MSSILDSKSLTAFKCYAIIVAGGSGTRMGAAIPKQFLLLNGLPVIMHTLKAFAASTFNPEVILVLHPDFHKYWTELCAKHNFTTPHVLINGGETRFHSVKNGLELVDDNSLVAVQDAVRPLTTVNIIDEAYRQAAEKGTAAVAVKSRDSIRRVYNNKTESLLRDEIYLVQTPQTFKTDLLKAAYHQPFDPGFTDDASVAEKAGNEIFLTEGDHTNLKITFPEDIAIAELLLRQRNGV